MKIVLRNGPEAGREFTVPDGAVSWLTPVKRALDKDQTWRWVFDYDGER